MTKNKINKAVTLTLTGIMAVSSLQVTTIHASDVQNVNLETNVKAVDGSVLTPEKGYTFLSAVKSENAVKQTGNIVDIAYVNGEKTRLTFLEETLFRLDMEPDGESFQEYATPNNAEHIGCIQQQDDASSEYSKLHPSS